MKPKINLFIQYLLLLAGILVPIFLIDQSIYQNAIKDRTILLPGMWIEAMTIDSKDRLWLATTQGVKMIENSNITSFDIGDSKWATHIGINENGEIWAIVGSGVIGAYTPAERYKYDGNNWIFQEKLESAVPRQNELPCCQPGDEFKVSDAESRKYSLFIPRDFYFGASDPFLKDKQGNFWAATRVGLVRFSSDFHISPPFLAFHNFLSSGGYFLIGIVTIILYSAILLYKRRASYNAKDVLVSIWASLGITVITFLLGTLLIGALGLLLVSLLMPDCWESCPMAVIFFSPLLGGLIAVIAGTIRGRKKYQSIKKERITNLPENKSTKPAAPILLIIWMIISQGVGIIFGVLIPAYLMFIVGAELDDSNFMNIIIFCFNPLFVMCFAVASWIFAVRKQYKITLLITTSIMVWVIFTVTYHSISLNAPAPTPTPSATRIPSPTRKPLPLCKRISTTVSPVIGAPVPSYDFKAVGFAPKSAVVVLLGDFTRGYMVVLEANDQGEVEGNIDWNGPARTEFTITFEGVEEEEKCALNRNVTWP